MKRLFNAIKHSLVSALSVAPLYVLMGCMAVRNLRWMLLLLCVTAAAVALLSFVPGKVGNRRREVKEIVPASSKIGGDPNPDRERPITEVKMRGISIPVRFPIVLIMALALAAYIILFCAEFPEATVAAKILTGLLGAGGFMFLVYDQVAKDPIFTGVRGTTVGIVLYFVSAVVCYFAKDAVMNRALVIFVCVYLVFAALVMNDISMETGVSSMNRAKPPKAIVRRNRLMLLLFGGITAIVAFMDELREAADTAGKAILRAIVAFAKWLASLFGQEETIATDSSSTTGDMSMFGEEATEASPFWEFMEKVAIVFAIIAGAILLFFALRALWRKLRVVLKKALERMKAMAQNMGEEYHDEQESLFDMDDMKDSLQAGLRKRLNKLLHRGKKWEQMDTREKMRAVIQRLYQKNGAAVKGLHSRTLREALTDLPAGKADKDVLAQQYEIARYSDEAPDAAIVEQCRKAAGV